MKEQNLHNSILKIIIEPLIIKQANGHALTSNEIECVLQLQEIAENNTYDHIAGLSAVGEMLRLLGDSDGDYMSNADLAGVGILVKGLSQSIGGSIAVYNRADEVLEGH